MTEVTFADALIAVGQHMKLCSDLPRPYDVYGSPYEDRVHVQLWDSGSASALASWATTMTDVTSWADRLNKDAVHAKVSGLIGAVRVTVWTSLPSEVFPAELGRHEWNVTALLQEA